MMTGLVFWRIQGKVQGRRDGRMRPQVPGRPTRTLTAAEEVASRVKRGTAQGGNLAFAILEAELFFLDQAYARNYREGLQRVEKDIWAAMPECGGVLLSILVAESRAANFPYVQFLRARVVAAGIDYGPLIDKYAQYNMAPSGVSWKEELFWVTEQKIPGQLTRDGNPLDRYYEQQLRQHLSGPKSP